jgi:hypothetical protein
MPNRDTSHDLICIILVFGSPRRHLRIFCCTLNSYYSYGAGPKLVDTESLINYKLTPEVQILHSHLTQSYTFNLLPTCL